MKGWLLTQRPRKFKVATRKVPFAVVMVVAGDSDLAPQVKADLDAVVLR